MHMHGSRPAGSQVTALSEVTHHRSVLPNLISIRQLQVWIRELNKQKRRRASREHRIESNATAQ